MNVKKEYKRLYSIWACMKSRCNNPNRPKYKIYGARGISVCEEWLSFKNFLKWALNNGYSEGLSIDRIDNNGDYCPDNCRFATPKQQVRNRSITLKATYMGVERTVYEWAQILGVDYYFLRSRLKRGMSIEEAITEPKRNTVRRAQK